MEKIFCKARAKINLSLEVLGKREDGYHDLESVFQKINWYDEIYIRKTKTDGCQVKTNKEELNRQENIVYHAYEKLKEKYPKIGGVEVVIHKKIPMQAGLGGGSTDAASFLLAMNKLFDLKLSKEEIEQIAQSLGADVVPCLYHQPVLGEGMGEKITKLQTNLKYYVVFIKPDISCNTKQMYEKLDTQKNQKQFLAKATKIIQALENNELKALTNHLYNVFEEVVEDKDRIQNLKKELLISGARGSLMTGSGSCVYGIFENKEKAKFAYQNLKKKYEVYIATTYHSKKGDLND